MQANAALNVAERLPAGAARVVVTGHAVRQYRRRVLCWERVELQTQKIVEKLSLIVRAGKRVSRLPGNSVWQYEHRGIYLAVAHRGPVKVVLTCLGDKTYRTWYRRKHKRKVF